MFVSLITRTRNAVVKTCDLTKGDHADIIEGLCEDIDIMQQRIETLERDFETMFTLWFGEVMKGAKREL